MIAMDSLIVRPNEIGLPLQAATCPVCKQPGMKEEFTSWDKTGIYKVKHIRCQGHGKKACKQVTVVEKTKIESEANLEMFGKTKKKTDEQVRAFLMDATSGKMTQGQAALKHGFSLASASKYIKERKQGKWQIDKGEQNVTDMAKFSLGKEAVATMSREIETAMPAHKPTLISEKAEEERLLKEAAFDIFMANLGENFRMEDVAHTLGTPVEKVEELYRSWKQNRQIKSQVTSGEYIDIMQEYDNGWTADDVAKGFNIEPRTADSFRDEWLEAKREIANKLFEDGYTDVDVGREPAMKYVDGDKIIEWSNEFWGVKNEEPEKPKIGDLRKHFFDLFDEYQDNFDISEVIDYDLIAKEAGVNKDEVLKIYDEWLKDSRKKEQDLGFINLDAGNKIDAFIQGLNLGVDLGQQMTELIVRAEFNGRNEQQARMIELLRTIQGFDVSQDEECEDEDEDVEPIPTPEKLLELGKIYERLAELQRKR